MKTLILILLMALTISSHAQKETDTIPVILLVCDTTTYEFLTINGKKDKHIYDVYWRYGYEVVEKQFSIYTVDGSNYDYQFISGVKKWQHIKYLNINKQPLNRVVWISKKRKKK